MKSDFVGHLSEFLARFWLRLKGYHILAKNYITGRGTQIGEVDIIAYKKNTLIFVEVKKRKTVNQAAYAILSRQRQRISVASQNFIKKNPQFARFNIRFDAVLVSFKPLKIKHLKNVW